MKNVIGAAIAIVALPAALAAVAETRYFLRNRNNGAIVSSGEKRDYILHVPRSYDPAKPAPLVISLHGATGWPAQQRDLSLWNRVADREGFIVVYPGGETGGPRVWNVNRGPGLQRDVRFIADLIDELRARYNIDPDRIYANGISNGGGMTFVLSCTLSNRIAAVGIVAPANTLPWSWCTDTRPMPMILLQGDADTMTPIRGGTTWVAPRPFPDITGWVSNWARRNRCDPRPADTPFAPDVTRRAYANCADGASVVFFTIRGGGHTWPGGQQVPEWFFGRTTRSVDASEEMWAFFRAHPLRARH